MKSDTDLAALAARIAEKVKQLAWDWEVGQDELEALILKELLEA